jgi:uncharacterized protein (TIGR00290 family)
MNVNMARHNERLLCSWSGGKDSCFALMQAIQDGYTPAVLLNVMNETGKISRSHGIPAPILQAQSNAARIPIHLINSSWETYEQEFTQALVTLKQNFELTHAVFGDIDLQAHRDWEEKVCANAGLEALLPLWQRSRRALVIEMLDAGIETMIVSCNSQMGSRFLGRMITPALVEELESMGIDACGENGEFHTLVINCPLFDSPIQVRVVDQLLHNDYWFSSLELG